MIAQPQWVGLEVWCSTCQAYTHIHAQALGAIGTGTNQAYSLTLACGHFDAAETILDNTRKQHGADGIAPKRMGYHIDPAFSPPYSGTVFVAYCPMCGTAYTLPGACPLCVPAGTHVS